MQPVSRFCWPIEDENSSQLPHHLLRTSSSYVDLHHDRHSWDEFRSSSSPSPSTESSSSTITGGIDTPEASSVASISRSTTPTQGTVSESPHPRPGRYSISSANPWFRSPTPAPFSSLPPSPVSSSPQSDSRASTPIGGRQERSHFHSQLRKAAPKDMIYPISSHPSAISSEFGLLEFQDDDRYRLP